MLPALLTALMVSAWSGAAGAGEAALLSEAELQRYAGDFWEAEEGFAAETAVDGGKLWAVHSPERRNELMPIGPDRFRMLGMDAEIIIVFEMGADGISRMTRLINGEPRGVFMPFERRYPAEHELGEYKGRYRAEVSGKPVRVEVRQGSLWFIDGGESARRLTALFGDTFEDPDYGSFVFGRDPGGAVSGFALRSRGSEDRHFRRADQPR
jgi:hypothetical protein